MSMTEKMNQRLYDKMSREYSGFIDRVKLLPPEQILDRAFEKVSKEDILCSLEGEGMEYDQAKALCRLEHPLEELYQQWLKTDSSYMESLRETMEERAGSAVIETKKAAKSKER